MSANTVYTHTRAVSGTPQLDGEKVTVTARLDGDCVGLDWQRSDRERRGDVPVQITVSVAELRAILEAVDSAGGVAPSTP